MFLETLSGILEVLGGILAPLARGSGPKMVVKRFPEGPWGVLGGPWGILAGP